MLKANKLVAALALGYPVLMSAGSVMAAPFLYADPTTEAVEQYACSIDSGADVLTSPVTLANGSKQLKMDLAGMAAGSHVITCKAKNNSWGIASAASSPFSAVKPAVMAAPGNIYIAP